MWCIVLFDCRCYGAGSSESYPVVMGHGGSREDASEDLNGLLSLMFKRCAIQCVSKTNPWQRRGAE